MENIIEYIAGSGDIDTFFLARLLLVILVLDCISSIVHSLMRGAYK